MLGRGSWVARTRLRRLDGKVVDLTRRGSTKGEARARLEAALGGVTRDRGDEDLAYYLDAWYASRERAGLTRRSLDTYRDAVASVKAALGGVLPAQLRASQVQSYLDGLGPESARLRLNALRGAIDQAALDGALESSPLLGVKITRPRRVEEPRALTVEEFRRFRRHMHAFQPRGGTRDPGFPRIVDWVGGTGCRTSEALGVAGEHVVDGIWTVSGTVIDLGARPWSFSRTRRRAMTGVSFSRRTC